MARRRVLLGGEVFGGNPVLGGSSGDVGDSVEVAKSWIRGRWRLVMSMESEGGARLSDV
jgi:hypothetical protein